MKKELSLGKSLCLLAAPLVASFNLGISPSSAAVLAGDGRGSENTMEIIARLGALDIDAANIDAANTDKSDSEVLAVEELLNKIEPKLARQIQLKDDLKSFWGNLSAGINDVLASNSETEYTPAAPVNVAPVNNVQVAVVNIQGIETIPASKNRDPLKVLLKSLNLAGGSDRANNAVPTRTYTGKVEPTEINASPVAEDITKVPSQQNKPATEKTYTAAPSTQAVSAVTQLKVAQLPSGLQGDREGFDYMQLAGGALGLGFFIWMLFQE